MSLALQTQTTQINIETVILGLGETGLSVANYLQQQSIPFMLADTRENPPELDAFKNRFPDAEYFLGELSNRVMQNAKQLIVSPGVDINAESIQSAIKCGVQCFGDIELFAQHAKAPIIAITGSNGKSTVTSLVTQMANEANKHAYAGGNLSPPALDLLSKDDAGLFVLELSSFQLESTYSLQPEVSVVLNISADHLDRHGDMQSYASIKANIYRQAKCSVVNRNDAYAAAMQTYGKVISFGLDQATDDNFGLLQRDGEFFIARGQQALMAVKKLALRGEAGVLNSLAALAIGQAIGLPMPTMLSSLEKFEGLAHRLSFVKEKNGVSWFNDSKGTNIGACISSLRSLEKNIILLAGGVYKGGDIQLLHAALKQHAKHMILFGKDADFFQESLQGAVNIHKVNNMQDAVLLANNLAISGDKVLLSPACASFDMYANYIQRGEDFEQCVRAVAK